MSDRMPEHMPEDMPDRMPNRMSEDMSDRMPEHMPGDMSDRMPNRMSDRMPEDLPVRKCINVMVGITRSKVFFLGMDCKLQSSGTQWIAKKKRGHDRSSYLFSSHLSSVCFIPSHVVPKQKLADSAEGFCRFQVMMMIS
jgi:hypothetical protein